MNYLEQAANIIKPYYTPRSIMEHINHPAHYGGQDNPYEAIKVIEAWDLGFSLGNAVKYIARAGKKNADTREEDLRKAIWYLERELGRDVPNKRLNELFEDERVIRLVKVRTDNYPFTDEFSITDILSCGFEWCKTEEGPDFWSSVCNSKDPEEKIKQLKNWK